LGREDSLSEPIRLPEDRLAVPLEPGVSFNPFGPPCNADPKQRHVPVPREQHLGGEGLNEARRSRDTTSDRCDGPSDALSGDRISRTALSEEGEHP
jgi:hypothetical protein